MYEDGSEETATAQELANDIATVADALVQIVQSNPLFVEFGIEAIELSASDAQVAASTDDLYPLQRP